MNILDTINNLIAETKNDCRNYTAEGLLVVTHDEWEEIIEEFNKVMVVNHILSSEPKTNLTYNFYGIRLRIIRSIDIDKMELIIKST
jgi:hypothetical protein